jgi:phosphohistidine phosphatase
MKVFFLRHGIAAERSDGNGEGNDAARPLTKEGIAKMKGIAATLAHLHLGLEAIITSPLVRARETAEIVARELKMTLKLVKDERLAPGFNADKLHAVLLDHPSGDAVMIVGHEPDFSETISALIGGGRVAMKKGGLALVDLPNAHSMRGELLWLAPPKVLRHDK